MTRLMRSGDLLRHIILIVAIFLLFIPTLLMLVISVKSTDQFSVAPFGLVFPFHWENFASAWNSLGPSILNSLVLSGVTAAFVTLFGALSGYAFARFEFVGRNVLFYAFLVLIMVPSVLILVPQFEVVRDLGLLDSWSALVLPWVAIGQVTAIFITRAFFETLPREVFEAARLDGAGELTVFFRMAVPMSKPVLAVVALFNVLGTWNDVIWPLVTINSRDLFPLSLGLLRFRDSFNTAWGPLMAGYVIASIPLLILFILANRSFVEGAVLLERKS